MRKILIFLFSTMMLALVGCHSSRSGKTLVEIDSLLDIKENDSAMLLLQKIPVQDFSSTDSAYFNLLYIVAQYQLWIPISSDSLLNRCIATFKNNDDKDKLIRAYYYRGCIKAVNLDNPIGGIVDLKQAESISSKTGNKLMMVKTEGMLCYLNYTTENYDIAKRYAWNVIKDAKGLGKNRWVGFGYQMLDAIYNKLGLKDSSDYYSLKSEGYAEYQAENEKYGYYRNIGNAYLSKGDLAKAEKYYQLSLAKKEDIETYGTLANLYAQQKEDAKAEENWLKSLSGTNMYVRSINLKEYSNWLREKGRTDESLKYAHEYMVVRDSLAAKAKEGIEIRDIQEKYDQKKQSDTYANKMRKIAIIVVLVVAVCIIVLFLLFRSHRKLADVEARLQENENKRNEQMALIEQLKSEGKEQTSQAKALMRELDILNADYNEALRKGEKYFKFIKDENGNTSTWTKAEFIYFLEYYKRLRPDFEPNSGENYATLTHTQRFLLCLQDMGMDDTSICDILCMTKGALRTARSRIRSRIG